MCLTNLDASKSLCFLFKRYSSLRIVFFNLLVVAKFWEQQLPILVKIEALYMQLYARQDDRKLPRFLWEMEKH